MGTKLQVWGRDSGFPLNAIPHLMKQSLSSCFVLLSFCRSTDYGTTYEKLNDKVGLKTVLSYLYVNPTNKRKVRGGVGSSCVLPGSRVASATSREQTRQLRQPSWRAYFMYWKPQATRLTRAFIGIIIIAKVIIIQMMGTATPVKLCSCA